MDNPITIVAGLPLWGKILLALAVLVTLLLIWRPWSSSSSTTAAASTTPTAVSAGQMPSYYGSQSVPLSSAPGTAPVTTTPAQIIAPSVAPADPQTLSGSGYYNPQAPTQTGLGGSLFDWIPAPQDVSYGETVYYEPQPGQFMQAPIGGAGGVAPGTPLYTLAYTPPQNPEAADSTMEPAQAQIVSSQPAAVQPGGANVPATTSA